MNLSISDLIIVIPILLFSMGFHEAIHAFVAHWLGDTTAQDMGRLTLNPLKHIDIVTTVLLPIVMILSNLPPLFAAKPVPFNPDRVRFDEFGAAMIGIAGPLSNLLLASLAAGLLRLGVLSGIADIAIIFIVINVSFFVFNMIPIPPLDGSRLLYAFAPEPLQKVMYQIESFGLMGIIIIFILFISVLGPGITRAVTELTSILVGSGYAI